MTIHDSTAALDVSRGSVSTATGSIRCRHVVLATEAYGARLPGRRRRVAPLYSLMIATEPLDPSQWREIGLDRRTTFSDLRRLVIYGQRTFDGRLAFGGRGAPYHFASRIEAPFDTDERVAAHLRATLVELFPVLRGTAVTHHWGGALGAPRDWSMAVSDEDGVLTGGGYVGDGVAASNLVGRILTSIVLGRDDDLVRLPIIGRRSRSWEPEPFRWLGINALLRLAALSDGGGSLSRLSGRLVDRFTN